MHDTGSLCVEKLSRAFDRRDVDALRGHRSPTTPLSGHQAFCQVNHEAIDRQRFQWGLKGSLDGVRQLGIRRNGLVHKGQRIGPSAEYL
jgi:hypothetical protein